MIKQLAHLCIIVCDLDATERFYCNVLGMKIAFEFQKNGARIGYYLDYGGTTFIEVFRKSAKFSEVQAVCPSLALSPLVGMFQAGYAELTAQLRQSQGAASPGAPAPERGILETGVCGPRYHRGDTARYGGCLH